MQSCCPRTGQATVVDPYMARPRLFESIALPSHAIAKNIPALKKSLLPIPAQVWFGKKSETASIFFSELVSSSLDEEAFGFNG